MIMIIHATTATSLFQIKYSLQSFCPQLAKVIRAGTRETRQLAEIVQLPLADFRAKDLKFLWMRYSSLAFLSAFLIRAKRCPGEAYYA